MQTVKFQTYSVAGSAGGKGFGWGWLIAVLAVLAIIALYIRMAKSDDSENLKKIDWNFDEE